MHAVNKLCAPCHFHHTDPAGTGGGGILQMAQGGDVDVVAFGDIQNRLTNCKLNFIAVNEDCLAYSRTPLHAVLRTERFQEMVSRHRSIPSETQSVDTALKPVISNIHFNLKRLRYTFYDETFDVSSWGIFTLSFIVGIIGGIYGIGGGAIISPFFVTFFGLPVYTIAGAALMGSFVTSIAGVIFYQAIAPIYPEISVGPDWLLGALFGLGGIAGMYLGARLQKYVSAKAIKWMLCAVLIFTASKYTHSFFQ